MIDAIEIQQGLSKEYYLRQYVVLPNLYDQPMYRISNEILLTGYDITKECQEFLDDNPDIPLEIPRIYGTTNQVIGTEIKPIFEIIRDEEYLGFKRLAIIFKIKGYPYDQILSMWDIVSKKVYAGMNSFTAKKIAVILDSD